MANQKQTNLNSGKPIKKLAYEAPKVYFLMDEETESHKYTYYNVEHLYIPFPGANPIQLGPPS
jgi:hypothetical protein